MKWTFIIQQKLKVSLLLFCIMALIIVTTLLARNNIGNLDKSFHSIYNDRLIPATDIFYLTENLFKKRLMLEKYLINEEKDDNILQNLAFHNQKVDSLISAYYQTYLVVDESKYLSEFTSKVGEYQNLEKIIIQKSDEKSFEEAKKIFYSEGLDLFNGTINNLQKLTQIQTKVGKNLMAESESDMANVTLLYTLQIILVFIIGAMVQALIFSSRISNLKRNQKYHLN